MLNKNESLTKDGIVHEVYKYLPADSNVRRYSDLAPIIDALFDVLSNAVLDEREIIVRGFGSIKPVVKKERLVMDFKSGKPIPHKAQKSVKMVLSKKISDRLNK